MKRNEWFVLIGLIRMRRSEGVCRYVYDLVEVFEFFEVKMLFCSF